MAKKRKKIRDLRDEYNEMLSLKINEVKGMHIGSREATEAANAVATLYSKGIEAEQRIKDSAINLGKAIAGVAGMTVETVMHERDFRTCLGLEQAYHSGKVEIANLRKDFKPRRLLSN